MGLTQAKTMRSAHAVQRHMVDTGRTRMLYEGNEEEYEDFTTTRRPRRRGGGTRWGR